MPILITIPQAIITTICSVASYTSGTPNSALDIPFSNLIAAGSALGTSIAQVGSHSTLVPSALAAYDSAFRSYQQTLSQATTITNADVADTITVNNQLVGLLSALSTTVASLGSPNIFAIYLYDLQVLVSVDHIVINKKIGGIACDKQNSLNSIGSQISSTFDAIRSQPWIRPYYTLRPPWASVSSVTCPLVCVTSTVQATSTVEDPTTIPSTTTDTTTAAVDTRPSPSTTADSTTATGSTTADIDTESSASTTADSSTTAVDTTGSTPGSTPGTSPNTEVTGSRTISGSIQRCIVRPTPTVVTPVTTPEVITVS